VPSTSTLENPTTSASAEGRDAGDGSARTYVDTPEGVAREGEAGGGAKPKKGLWDRLEAWVSRLSTRNNFWHKVCSWIWLPIAYRSGIKKVKQDTREGEKEPFVALLPFRRFNRNWYSAMAGAALLANSEIAGGMYVFDVVGGDYTVVCKELHYRFRRPCHGPAVYRVKTKADLHALVRAGGEFNIDVEIEIYQALKQAGERLERRVGVSSATFHVTPKEMAKERARKHREKERQKRERQMARRAAEAERDADDEAGAGDDAGRG